MRRTIGGGLGGILILMLLALMVLSALPSVLAPMMELIVWFSYAMWPFMLVGLLLALWLGIMYRRSRRL
jgi:hypothetical protein